MTSHLTDAFDEEAETAACTNWYRAHGGDSGMLVGWLARARIAHAEREKLQLEVLQWKEQYYRPSGDNHHNADVCPYCSPKRQAERETIRRGAMEEAAKLIDEMPLYEPMQPGYTSARRHGLHDASKAIRALIGQDGGKE